MNLSKRARLFISAFMSVILTNIPYIAAAESLKSGEMVPTSVVVEQINRRGLEEKVQEFISRHDVRGEFLKRGVSPEEVSMRIASLSDRELKDLAAQMDQARYGGDGVVGILVVVLIVVLIIFLVKRI